MSELPPGIERAFRLDSAFESAEAGFSLTTFPFHAHVTFDRDDEDVSYLITFTLPTLNAVVIDDDVPAIVQEGWRETLERRLQGADGCSSALEELIVKSMQNDEHLEVTMTFVRPVSAAPAVDVVLALATYVEGTYLQGIIPEYSYDSPVAELLDRAKEHGS